MIFKQIKNPFDNTPLGLRAYFSYLGGSAMGIEECPHGKLGGPKWGEEFITWECKHDKP